MYPSWGCGNEEVRAPGVLSPRLLLSRIKARSLTAQTAPNHPLPFPLPTPSTTPPAGFYGADCSLSLGSDGKPGILAGLGYRPATRKPLVYIYEVPPRFNTW